MVFITSLRSFARRLTRATMVPPGSGEPAVPRAPDTLTDHAPDPAAALCSDVSPDVSRYAAYAPRRSAEVQALELRVAELSTALAISARRARAADLLAEQTAELSVSGVRVVDATLATVGKSRDETRSLAELLTLIDGMTSRMQALARQADAEATWAGEHDAAFTQLAGDARRLAEDGATTAHAARRHIDASVAHAETGVARATEAVATIGDIVRSLEQVRLTLAGETDTPPPALGIRPAGGAIG